MPSYLISKAIDPVFAVSVGVGAFLVRLNREEKAKGRTTTETIEAFKRRTALLFDTQPEAPAATSQKP